MEPREFVPQIVSEGEHQAIYGLMLVSVKRCPLCKEIMIEPPCKDYYQGPFPRWIECSFESQIKRAGWVIKSGVEAAEEAICATCAASGKAYFLCDLCGEKRSTDEVQVSIGDPPVYLCKQCYKTIPAQEWDDKEEHLREEHRYDFE